MARNRLPSRDTYRGGQCAMQGQYRLPAVAAREITPPRAMIFAAGRTIACPAGRRPWAGESTASGSWQATARLSQQVKVHRVGSGQTTDPSGCRSRQ